MLHVRFSHCSSNSAKVLGEVPAVVHQLPYHYVESAQGYQGGRLENCQNAGSLIFMICWICFVSSRTGSESKGFLIPIRARFNFNPDQFNYQSAEEGIDNRVEVIYQTSRDWLEFETALMQCRIVQEK